MAESTSTSAVTNNNANEKNETETNEEVSERLRLEGNEAFSQQDYKKAIQLYGESNKHKKQAKTYSNLAAALCKDKDRMNEAIKAAERATILDPNWGKGYWRYGMLLEQTFEFDKAKKQYEKAVENEPAETSFQNALKTLDRKLASINKQKGSGNGSKATPAGVRQQQRAQQRRQMLQQQQNGANASSLQLPDRKELLKRPGYKAWMEAVTITGPGSTFKVLGKYALLQNESSKELLAAKVTSRQWLILGFADWVNGMKRSIAEFAKSVSREADMACKSIIQQRSKFKSEEGFLLAFEEVLGGFPDRMGLFSLSSGFSCLGGNFIFLETAVTPGAVATALKTGSTLPTSPQEVPYMCPPKRFLENLSHYQHMSLLWSIDMVLTEIMQRHKYKGNTIQCSKAIIQGSMTLWSNIPNSTFRHVTIPHPERHDPTPTQVLEYMKQQLRSGHITWKDSMSKFCSLQYRGTMLYAALLRWNGAIIPSYNFMKWAREFITLADKEFDVSSTKRYQEYGSAFKPSFRIGMMVAELITLQPLRGNNVSGQYSMETSLELCMEIIRMAELVDVSDQPNEYLLVQWDVAARRKPLSIAHGTIAHHLNILRSMYPTQFQQIVSKHGLIETALYSDDEECDPFAVIAHHYRIAADNELADSDQGASLWWAHAACMAQARSDRCYTLERLQTAMERAHAADAARDVDLFGPNVLRGGTFEAIAKLTAEHFQNESSPSSFILPQVEIVRRQGETPFVRVGDDIICKDFTEYQKREGEIYLKAGGVAPTAVATSSNHTQSSLPNANDMDDPIPKIKIEDNTAAAQMDAMADAMANFETSLN